MNILTDYQIINNEKGQPLFAVIPYADFQRIQAIIEEDKLVMPDEVVRLNIMEGRTLLSAWREYRGLTVNDMSERMGISVAEYSEAERKESLPSQIRDRAAKVLRIDSRLFEI